MTIRHLIFPSQRLLPGERQSRFQSRAELSELSISIAEEADFSPFSARSSGAISNMQMSRRKSDATADLIRPLSNPFYEQSGRSPLIRWKTEKREASTKMIFLHSLSLRCSIFILPMHEMMPKKRGDGKRTEEEKEEKLWPRLAPKQIAPIPLARHEPPPLPHPYRSSLPPFPPNNGFKTLRARARCASMSVGGLGLRSWVDSVKSYVLLKVYHLYLMLSSN